ncbi:MAG: hypothetical protein A4E38_00083 [Methanoregulaceae archaeon PtaB.Bin108]|jgi:hypothetical protein|nr:MAG: hypothetical protein A4E38_00083 [Methanoregulaceae archaeon PtaB.Bin108]OPY43618.1 MAG: hypothetical protein A4E42_01264 [Methanoregulaceae archaeon PtaU1.Bin222]
MADFVEQSVTKTATRELTTPFADIAALNTVVNSVISTNPFGCTAYETGGQTMDAVAKTREYYNGRVIFEDDDAKTVGYVTIRAPTAAAFATMKTEVIGDAEMATAMGGDASDDFERDTYSIMLRCHDPSGELYYVTFTRDQVRVSSYSADAILAVIEAWADTVPALA